MLKTQVINPLNRKPGPKKDKLIRFLFLLPALIFLSHTSAAQESPFPNEGMEQFEMPKPQPLVKEFDSLGRIKQYSLLLEKIIEHQNLPLENHQDSLEYIYGATLLVQVYGRLENIDMGMETSTKTKRLLKEWQITNNVIIAELLLSQADLYNYINDLDNSAIAVDSALVMYEKGPYQNTNLYSKIVDQKYLVYSYIPSDTDTTFKYLDIMMDILKNHPDKIPPRFIDRAWDNLLNIYSVAYDKTGDFAKSTLYILESIRRMEERQEYNTDNYESALFQLAVNYYYSEQFEKSANQARRLIKIISARVPPGHIELVQYYNLLAVNYNGLNKPDSAVVWLEKCARILETPEGYEDMQSSLLLNIGASQMKLKDFESSGDNLNKALKLNQKVYGQKHVANAPFYRYLYEHEHLSGNHRQALDYIDNALQNLLPSYKGGLSAPIEISSDDLAFGTLEYLNLYIQQLMAAYGESPEKREYLEAIIDRAAVVQNVLDSKQTSLDESESILFHSAWFKSFHEVVLNALSLLYDQTGSQEYLSQAIGYMTASKSRSLVQELGELKLVNDSSVPEDLRLEFIQARKQVDRIDGKLNDLMSQSVLDDSIKMLNTEKFHWSNRLTEAKERLRNDHKTSDVLLSPDTDLTSILELYTVTNENEAIIEYFMGEDNIFVLAVSKSKKTLVKLARDKEFDNNLALFLDQIQTSPSNGPFSQFSELSFYLYNKLAAPVINTLDSKIDRLIIIPDEQLTLLPFDLLTQDSGQEANGFKDLNYLVRTKNISYQLSASNLKNQSAEKKKSGILGLGYGEGEAIADERSGLGGLPGSVAEIGYLKNNFRGSFSTGKPANKQEFLKKAGQYDILHLALHGKADLNNRFNSSLIFNGDTDYDLKTYDLYGIGLNSRLVFLSSCESGLGKLASGNGSFSVGRGFAAVGVPSIVTTLWKINDQASTLIVKGFYENLKQGMDKDEALRRSKLSFLDNADNITSAPYYWAGFIVLGDVSAIELEEKTNKNIYLVLIVFLLFVTALVMKKRWAKRAGTQDRQGRI